MTPPQKICKRVGRNRMQFLNGLRNKRRYWDLQEEARYGKSWERIFMTRSYEINTFCLPEDQGNAKKQHTS